MSFPGPGFAGCISSKMKPGNTPTELQQANVITVTLVTESPDGAGIGIPIHKSDGGSGAPSMGWISGGSTGSSHDGLLKYTIKNENGSEIFLIDSAHSDNSVGMLFMRAPDGVDILRLSPASQTGNKSLSILLPSGESLGDVVVETKIKKDKKGKEDKPDKPKKDKEEKKSKHGSEKKDKDKDKDDTPNRKYLLNNPNGQEVMKVSLKSKPKDLKLEIKIKSLQRKGEICYVESIAGTNSFQMRFQPTSTAIPNEKLYVTGAVIGIVDLEMSKHVHQPVGGPLYG